MSKLSWSKTYKSCEVLCPAKVNLYLNTLRKREDGFHEIASVFQAVSLFDKLTVSKTSTEIKNLQNLHKKKLTPKLTFKVHENSTVTKKLIGADFVKNNLLHKVFAFFNTEYGITDLTVTLYKHIPIGAGLGGGSSDVAGFIFAINTLFKLGLKKIRLEEIGAKFGSDVPFFFGGGMAWVGGRGEKIEQNPYALAEPILIAYPGVFLATPISYRLFNTLNPKMSIRPLKTKIAEINQSNINWRVKKARIAETLGKHIYNSFQEKTLKNHPELVKTYAKLREISPFSMMSGSGSSFFCIFHDIILLEEICRKFRENYPAGATFARVDCIPYGVRLKTLK